MLALQRQPPILQGNVFQPAYNIFRKLDEIMAKFLLGKNSNSRIQLNIQILPLFCVLQFGHLLLLESSRNQSVFNKQINLHKRLIHLKMSFSREKVRYFLK